MVTKKDMIGMTTIVVLLITSILGFTPESEDTHICIEDNFSMSCDHLSDSLHTCYPTEGTRIGSKYCSGIYKPIDRSDLDLKETRIMYETSDGTLIDCEVTNDILKSNSYCYYNDIKHFRSEFD